MPFICTKCGVEFSKQRDLQLHEARKRPCNLVSNHLCVYCHKSYTRADSLSRHKKVCVEARTAEIAAQLATVQARLDLIEQKSPVGGVSVTNSTINNTINNTVTNLTIAPWGAPLQLTDADVEAALASIPGVAGTLALPEVVSTLMELVKRAHASEAARNVYLNPKRGDQALALTPTGGWAAMPLTEATAALFDGASARIATPVARRRVNALYATVPVQYRADKAQTVALGLRPMEAHLANMMPGGPGPLLLEGPAVAAGAAAGAAAQPRLDPGEAAALVKRLPASYEPGGAVTAEWLAAVLAETGACAADLTRALRSASARGLCGFAEWQGIMRLGAPPAR